ncbi:hypothetical protein ACFL6S_03525 [Candidatus Poribacteria bacterium]
MPKLFVLGTGFSKAVSNKMPTMEDLEIMTQGEHSSLHHAGKRIK